MAVRVFAGGVTDTSARFRLEGPLGGFPPLRFAPDTGGIGQRGPRPVPPAQGFGDGPWIVDVDGLQPDTLYTVRPAAGDVGVPSSATIRTAPAALAGGHTLRLALSSCYFPSHNFRSNAATLAEVLRIRGTPHAMLLCGDQIYADVPGGGPPPDRLYEERYAEWYQAAFGGRLAAAAGHFNAPDDHEYWNSYPDRMQWLSRSWDGNWGVHATAARDALWKHQGVGNFPAGFQGGEGRREGWAYGQLAGLDLFVTDTRSVRTSRDGKRRPEGWAGNAAQAMGADQLAALLRWLRHIPAGRPGFLALGQPLALKGGGQDNALDNYSEFALLMRAVRAALDRGAHIVVLTGDIHWGRLMTWARPGGRGGILFEYCASPIARVALQSTFSRKYDGGRRSDVDGKPSADDLAVVQPYLDGYAHQKWFATGEHNVGFVDVTEDDATGRLRLSFETWSILDRRKAVDQWSLHKTECLFSTPLP